MNPGSSKFNSQDILLLISLLGLLSSENPGIQLDAIKAVKSIAAKGELVLIALITTNKL
jgi:hypothetical protein